MRWGIVTGVIMAAAVSLPSAAMAADYPPATYGQGQVDRTVVHPGECVHFSGGGYAKNAHLTVTDNDATTARGKADRNGDFRIQVCFGTDATLGPHRLQAEGQGANGAPRFVSATVTVVGLSETFGGSTGGGTVSGGSGNGSGTATNTGTGTGSSGSTGTGSGGSGTSLPATGPGGGSGSSGGTGSGGVAAAPHHTSHAGPWLLVGVIAAVALIAGAGVLGARLRRRRLAEV